MTTSNDLTVAAAAYTAGPCAVVYVDAAGELRVTSNGRPFTELADLLERAAGMVRAASDPDATRLG